MSRILIIDDEESICWALREALADEGHAVEVTPSAEEGLRVALAGGGAPEAILLDVRLPGMDGLTALGRFRRDLGETPVIVMTAFGSLETAVKAMEGGAFDYLVKPFDLDQATGAVRRALDSRRASAAPTEESPGGEDLLVGSSPALQELFKRIALVAPTDVPVLITGESGTGKELVARAIHRHSARRSGPFLAVCPAALSPGLVESELFGHVKGAFTGADRDRKGLFELAEGGTVLLDEIGDIPEPLQVKLLRAVERREVTPVGDARPRPADVRFLAATNRPMARLVEEGRFRDDLFYRLSVFPVVVPPLRDRREDIPALAAHFLRLARPQAPAAEITPEALDALKARAWAGNVRELRNAIEHAAVVSRGQPVRPEHLPTSPAIAASASTAAASDSLEQGIAAWAEREAAADREGSDPLYERFLGQVEPPLLRAALRRCGGNRAAASELLGIHRATLRQKLRKYNIDG